MSSISNVMIPTSIDLSKSQVGSGISELFDRSSAGLANHVAIDFNLRSAVFNTEELEQQQVYSVQLLPLKW